VLMIEGPMRNDVLRINIRKHHQCPWQRVVSSSLAYWFRREVEQVHSERYGLICTCLKCLWCMWREMKWTLLFSLTLSFSY
jgi:hypothetical protein